MNWLQLANRLALDAPHLLGAFITIIHDIAHGEGGPAKVLNVVNEVEQVGVEAATDIAAATGSAVAGAAAVGASK